jgi:hypothetical protein
MYLDAILQAVSRKSSLVAESRKYVENWGSDVGSIATFAEVVAIKLGAKDFYRRNNFPVSSFFVLWDAPSQLCGEGITRIGGVPNRPDVSWPTLGGRPAVFIAQVEIPKILQEKWNGDILHLYGQIYDETFFDYKVKHTSVILPVRHVLLDTKLHFEILWKENLTICLESWSDFTIQSDPILGCIVNSLENPFMFEDQDNPGLGYWLANLPTTKFCEGYWSTSANRFFSDELDFACGSIPVFQFTGFDQAHSLSLFRQELFSVFGNSYELERKHPYLCYTFADGFTMLLFRNHINQYYSECWT